MVSIISNPQDVDVKFGGWKSACRVVSGHKWYTLNHQLLQNCALSSYPRRPLDAKRSYFCIWGLLGVTSRRALGAGNDIIFCQISHYFLACVFGLFGEWPKPSQKFPELLHELWPGPEGEALPLSGGMASGGWPSPLRVSVYLFLRDLAHFSKDLLLL